MLITRRSQVRNLYGPPFNKVSTFEPSDSRPPYLPFDMPLDLLTFPYLPFDMPLDLLTFPYLPFDMPLDLLTFPYLPFEYAMSLPLNLVTLDLPTYLLNMP